MNEDFSTVLTIEKSPREVFDAINNVTLWWSNDFAGTSESLNDQFEVSFGDVHYSKQKIVERIPDQKIVWLVIDSNLTFLKNSKEWTGTSIHFELLAAGESTELKFTHAGLVPSIECFKDCSKGWNYYLPSLVALITTGEGYPNKKK